MISFAGFTQLPPSFINISSSGNHSKFETISTRCQFSFSTTKIDATSRENANCPPFTMQLKDTQTETIVGDEETAIKVVFLKNKDAFTRNIFRKIRYKHVYRDIDLLFYFNGDKLEYDFDVSPQADPRRIQFSFSDATVTKQSDNRLLIEANGKHLFLNAPRAWQQQNGKTKKVNVEFRIDSKSNVVGFEIGAYDPSHPLIIDPVVDWSATIIDGENTETVADIAIDDRNNLYVLGSTNSASLAGIFPAQQNRNQDIFLAKLSYPELQIQSIVYLSGNDQDIARFISVDKSGTASIVAETNSSDLVVTSSTNSFRGDWDVYIARLDQSGNVLAAGYWGGKGADFPHAVTTDQNNNIYIAGETWSDDLPTTEHAFQLTCLETAICNNANGFLLRMNTSIDLNSEYASYLGGSSFDAIHAIAFDRNSNTVHVAGETASSDFPTIFPIQSTLNGAYDGFVATFELDKSSHQTLTFSSFVGGSGYDSFRAIAVDSNGNSIVGGETDSLDFPAAHISFQNPCVEQNKCDEGTSNALIVEIDHHVHDKIKHANVFGGTNNDSVAALRITSQGLLVVGNTSSRDFVVTENALSIHCNQNATCSDKSRDIFFGIWDLSRGYDDQLLYSSYIGGSGHDIFGGLQVATDKNIYLGGTTNTSNWLNPSFPAKIANDTGFAMRIAPPPTNNRYLNRVSRAGQTNACQIDFFFLFLLLNALIFYKPSAYRKI